MSDRQRVPTAIELAVQQNAAARNCTVDRYICDVLARAADLQLRGAELVQNQNQTRTQPSKKVKEGNQS